MTHNQPPLGECNYGLVSCPDPIFPEGWCVSIGNYKCPRGALIINTTPEEISLRIEHIVYTLCNLQ